MESFYNFLLKNSFIEKIFLDDFNSLIDEEYFELYNQILISSKIIYKNG